MKPYYYVYEYGNKAPKVRHATLQQAETEAKRLVLLSPGVTFEILMAVGMTKLTTPQTFWADGVTHICDCPSFGVTPEEESAEKELRDGYLAAKDGYEGTCENCVISRVELCRNGKLICEKCHWDQGTHQYDGKHREIFG